MRQRTLLLALLQLCTGHGRRVHVKGRQLIVADQTFLVRGICYSPIPINESVYFAPYGDYFTADYSFIWLRDLPLIKKMGVNVVRIYGWQPDNDHNAFLDAVDAHGLYLMSTYYMGDATESPVSTVAERSAAIKGFRNEVAKYAKHPSLLFWSFGNELNGVWNKFLQALSKGDPTAGEEDCGWDERYDDLGGCWIHKGKNPRPGSPCYDSSACVYKRLFTLMNDAAKAAHDAADVLVVSAFADVDGLYEKVGRVGEFASDLDAWTAQVYRGSSFGDFFDSFGNSTDKPILLTEYGVDAYHDACGSSNATVCFNTFGDDSGSHEDEAAQAVYAVNLTREILHYRSDGPECAGATRGDDACATIGGFLMSWTDEFWKGAKSQAGCVPTRGHKGFSPHKCDEKAHVTCGNWDAADHDLCGYFLDAAPDKYVNEEWFGITSPTQCANAIDALRPRETYWKMREVWTGEAAPPHKGGFPTCDSMIDGTCAALGGGETDWWLPRGLFGASRSAHGDGAVCSGRGHCTTDWRECGAGTSGSSATPCCSCDFGFSGLGCDALDVRVYVGAIVGVGLMLLLALIFTSSVASAVSRKMRNPDLTEGLLSAPA